jgi:hypothetical protein
MPQGIEAPASITAEGQTSHTLFQAARPANTFGYTREQQIEALRKLREPFKPEEIRYLPRIWCRACKSAGWSGCQQHPVSKCGKCKQKMPRDGHIDLAYVGHAEATNRLLNVDPFWDWEPLTVDERGLPQVDGYRGLWIRLTVCGMTRLGYGHAGDKTGGDAVKEVIGDAIRNAGMRFGMALDLWTSSDLEIIESGGASLDDSTSGVRAEPSRQAPATTASRKTAEPTQEKERQESREEAFARLTEQYRNCWGNALALAQIRLEGKKLGFSGDRVQGPPPESKWMTFDELLESRITELSGSEGRAA